MIVQTGVVPQREAQDPAERLGDALDLLAALVAVGLIVLVDDGRQGLPRILLAAGFAFFVPGRAIASNWPRMAAWSEAAMPVILSLAVLMFGAMVTLWAQVWYPMRLFQVEAWLSLAALAVGATRRRRRRLKATAKPGVVARGNAPRGRHST
jgi:hypothetical protein